MRSTLCVLALVIGLGNAATVPNDQRVDCYPDPKADQNVCGQRGCVWDTNYQHNTFNAPECYFDPEAGYTVTQQNDTAALLAPISGTVNPFGTNFQQLQFAATKLGSALKITINPVGTTRYRPPVPLNLDPIDSSENLSFDVANDSGVFSFHVTRDSTKIRLWDTSIGGLQFADQFIQIATYLPTDKIYGFGENIHQELKHDFSKYTTWGLYARDQGPESDNGVGKNLYGVHPFYLCIEADGKAHGVFIFNSNAMDVTTGPAPHLIYRTIGGQIELYFFPGPSPEDVIRQYNHLIGKPFLPAYWALGFQISRWGYNGVNEVKDVVNRTKAAGIPQDVQFADIDYMDRYKDFTYDHDKWADWPNYTEYLHSQGQRVILIFDPAIEADYDVFQRGIDANVSWIEWPRDDMVPQDVNGQYPMAKNSRAMLGKVWPDKHVAFPDFLDPTGITTNWWADEFKRYHDIQAFDGIWIDMNEPANHGTNNKRSTKDNPSNIPLECPRNGSDSALDMPPYKTQGVYIWGDSTTMASNTLCMIASTMRGQNTFYNTKSLYGYSESVATWTALEKSRGKRAAIISRSTFPGTGTVGGHWLGDNRAEWDDLRTSIIGIQEFNMFGMPYVGADICGFNRGSNEELCLRWQQLGAFYSFMRNHNAHNNPAQDPATWPTVAKAARISNLFRYRHLPYLFSLHFNATRYGGTVVKPLFFEFPFDSMTHDLSKQFLWGPAVLVAPVIEAGVKTVSAYLPVEATWYSLFDTYYGSRIDGGRGVFPAPWTSIIPTFLRGGYILPRQAPALTTAASRLNQFELVIASDNDNSGSGKASGELYWDDGDTWIPIGDIEKHNFFHFKFDFTYNSGGGFLNITSDHTATGITLPSLNNIEVFGYQYHPDQSQVYVNGQQVTIDSLTYSPFTKVVNITSNGLIDLNKGSATLQWKNK
uniref:P-type domain-containing protein n=1 Tax=Panagrellus redivivus TaxID=6233 RepID=A0A7E4W746_PANRE